MSNDLHNLLIHPLSDARSKSGSSPKWLGWLCQVPSAYLVAAKRTSSHAELESGTSSTPGAPDAVSATSIGSTLLSDVVTT